MGRARYLVVTVAIALVGCGDDSPDVGAIERDLAAGVEQDTGTRDVTVTCPDDVGEGALCDVTAAGGVKAQVKVTGLDGEAEGELVQP